MGGGVIREVWICNSTDDPRTSQFFEELEANKEQYSQLILFSTTGLERGAQTKTVIT